MSTFKDSNGVTLNVGDLVIMQQGHHEGRLGIIKSLTTPPRSDPKVHVSFTTAENGDGAWCRPEHVGRNRVQSISLLHMQMKRETAEAAPAAGAASSQAAQPAGVWDLNTLLIVRSYRSQVCPSCGRIKQPGQSFCYKCFKALPADLQSDLYKRLDEGYERAFAMSLAALNVRTPVIPEK